MFRNSVFFKIKCYPVFKIYEGLKETDAPFVPLTLWYDECYWTCIQKTSCKEQNFFVDKTHLEWEEVQLIFGLWLRLMYWKDISANSVTGK